MPYHSKLSSIVLAATLLGITASSQAAAASLSGAAEPSVWQRHQATINHYGITAVYTCDGLEDKVRALLLYFGARADLKVHASGCLGPNRPSRTASVSTDFYTLAAAAAGDPDAVPGSWSGVTITPMRPSWMGGGECELVAEMKGLLSKSFSMRGVDYRASCYPHEVSVADYSIRAEVLKPAAVNSD